MEGNLNERARLCFIFQDGRADASPISGIFCVHVCAFFSHQSYHACFISFLSHHRRQAGTPDILPVLLLNLPRACFSPIFFRHCGTIHLLPEIKVRFFPLPTLLFPTLKLEMANGCRLGAQSDTLGKRTPLRKLDGEHADVRLLIFTEIQVNIFMSPILRLARLYWAGLAVRWYTKRCAGEAAV